MIPAGRFAESAFRPATGTKKSEEVTQRRTREDTTGARRIARETRPARRFEADVDAPCVLDVIVRAARGGVCACEEVWQRGREETLELEKKTCTTYYQGDLIEGRLLCCCCV